VPVGAADRQNTSIFGGIWRELRHFYFFINKILFKWPGRNNCFGKISLDHTSAPVRQNKII
jgi:hypothetical protein